MREPMATQFVTLADQHGPRPPATRGQLAALAVCYPARSLVPDETFMGLARAAESLRQFWMVFPPQPRRAVGLR
jgi:hypothetical protein